MEIWLGDLQKALDKMEKEFGNLFCYVAHIYGATDGIIFLITNGETYKYIPSTDELIKLRGDWR